MKKKSKKIKTTRKKIRAKKQNIWRILFKFVFAFLAIEAGLTSTLLLQSNTPVSRIASRDSLQLETFYPPTKTPTPRPTSPPVDACNHHDDGTAVDPACFCPQYLVHCVGGQCVDINLDKSGLKMRDGHLITCDDTHPPAFHTNWCQPPIGQPDGWNCLGKPVIYLYPTHPMFVDVAVETPGKIITSIPLYPTGGWKNVYAEPNGNLTYNNSSYKELFYESSVKDLPKPGQGITLSKEKVEKQLDLILTKLGLIQNEKQEFLDWWVPKLQQLNSPYIFFSLIDQNAKDTFDHVVISPEPDTKIEFIAYFRPISEPYTGAPLRLPVTPPKRIGFTSVEWGGTIGSN